MKKSLIGMITAGTLMISGSAALAHGAGDNHEHGEQAKSVQVEGKLVTLSCHLEGHAFKSKKEAKSCATMCNVNKGPFALLDKTGKLHVLVPHNMKNAEAQLFDSLQENVVVTGMPMDQEGIRAFMLEKVALKATK